jgi:drug/metabolite transporter (DMT)-like permease
VNKTRHGAWLALGAAALFGASAPLSKMLLTETGPLALAGLLYLGAGVGLSLLPRALRPNRGSGEAPFTRDDLPLLCGIVLAGGIVAPVLQLTGLARTSGVAGSLLLNLETPFTVTLALWVFGERLTARAGACVVLVLLGAVLLGPRPGEVGAPLLGSLAIAGACLGWAIDTNLTQRLSGKDPVAIARVKCLVAGATNLGLSLVVEGGVPGGRVVLLGAALGFVSYGVSLVFAIYALRAIGAARFSACFATAPFVGALAAIPLLGELPGLAEIGGMVLMAVGIRLLLGEKHAPLAASPPSGPVD